MSGLSQAPSPGVLARLRQALEGLEPLAAARTLQQVFAEVLANLDEADKAEVLMGLAGEPGEDKVSSLVHL
ncbi:MAG: hypothetical protein HY794_16765 [Desulfarculus sp.]|nr:hypothetical protein [Desulfarculus sp.]